MYLTEDGKRLLASDEADLVAQLRVRSFTPSDDFHGFMRDVAIRAKLQTGHDVRCDSPENFVADLIAAGLITEAPLQ
jgi:hypothetical protein